ncbi:MAG: glycoside hydrolase family 140 protein, partial [Acidobacteriales bacterium]|nr:glycoside hydrolase family 140 protein [Terriglobales bacterium]
DDGTKPPTDHAHTGVPLPWKKALTMPGAEQMAHVYSFFITNDFSRLRPTPAFVVNNPGGAKPSKYVAAARSDEKDVMIVYVPEERTIEIKLNSLPPSPNISWFNPRNGQTSPAVAVVTTDTCQFPTPEEGDWLLLMKTGRIPAESETKKEEKR